MAAVRTPPSASSHVLTSVGMSGLRVGPTASRPPSRGTAASNQRHVCSFTLGTLWARAGSTSSTISVRVSE